LYPVVVGRAVVTEFSSGLSVAAGLLVLAAGAEVDGAVVGVGVGFVVIAGSTVTVGAPLALGATATLGEPEREPVVCVGSVVPAVGLTET
jgi:hypothetical protein